MSAATPPGADAAPRRLEGWVLVSFAFAAACFLAFVYLGMRTGGESAIWVHSLGRYYLAIGALLFLPVALVCAWRSRPMLTRARGWAFVCLAGTVGVAAWPIPYQSPYPPSAVAFRVPGEGTWRVLLGGPAVSSNPLRMIPARCTAVQLTLDEGDSPLRADAPEVPGFADFQAFGAPVLAPCDGVVVQAVGELADAPPTERTDRPSLGNHLVLEVASEEFLYLANLRAGSLRVAVGERVARGQVLAEVGASGRPNPTSVPHLEVFVANQPVLERAEGVPWQFHDYVADGVPQRAGVPEGGVTRRGAWTGQRIEAGP